MPARDLYHNQLKLALIKDGWTVAHDPLRLSWGGKDMYVDLGAERLLAAEKGDQRIAVEIKSFIGESDMQDLNTHWDNSSCTAQSSPSAILAECSI